MKIMAEQCGRTPSLTMLTDALAAQGLCARQGAGRVKHFSVRQLWAQEREANGELKINKVPRLMNAADLMTLHYTPAEGARFMALVSFERVEAAGASTRGGVSGISSHIERYSQRAPVSLLWAGCQPSTTRSVRRSGPASTSSSPQSTTPPTSSSRTRTSSPCTPAPAEAAAAAPLAASPTPILAPLGRRLPEPPRRRCGGGVPGGR